MNTEDSAGQQSGPDFGDLLDAYDLNSEEAGNKDGEEAEPNADKNGDKIPHVKKSVTDESLVQECVEENMVVDSDQGDKRTMEQQQTSQPESGAQSSKSPDLLPTSTNEELMVHVNQQQESSLQTLSRFVEELSSPSKESVKKILPTVNAEQESSVCEPFIQTFTFKSSVNKMTRDKDCISGSEVSTESVQNSQNFNKESNVDQTLAVCQQTINDSDVNVNKLSDSSRTELTNSSEKADSTSVIVDTSAVGNPERIDDTSVTSSTNENAINLDIVSTVDHSKSCDNNETLLKDSTNSANDSTNNTNNSIERPITHSKDTDNTSLTHSKDSARIGEDSLILPGTVVENTSSQPLVTRRQSTCSSSNSAVADGILSVSVTDDGRQTFHCMDEDTDQIISFHIENIPDDGSAEEEMDENDDDDNNGQNNTDVSMQNRETISANNMPKDKVSESSPENRGENENFAPINESNNKQNTSQDLSSNKVVEKLKKGVRIDSNSTYDQTGSNNTSDTHHTTVPLEEQTSVLIDCLENNGKSTTNVQKEIDDAAIMTNIPQKNSSTAISKAHNIRRHSANSEGAERVSEHFNPLNLSSPSSSVCGDTYARDRPGSSMSLPSPKSVHSFQSSNPSPVNLNQKEVTSSNKDATSSKNATSGRINKRKRKDPVRSHNYVSSGLEEPATATINEPQLGTAPISINPKPMHVKEERHDKSYDSNPMPMNHFGIQEESPSLQTQPWISNVHSLNPYSQFLAQNAQKTVVQPTKTPRSRARPKQKEIVQQQFQQQQHHQHQQQQQQQNQQAPMNFMNNGMYNPQLDNHNMRPPMRPMNYHHIQPINIAPEGPLQPPQGYARYFPPPPHPNIRMPHNPYSIQPPPAYNAYARPPNRNSYCYDPYPFNRPYRPPPSNQPPVSSSGSVVVHHTPHRAPFIIRPDNMPPNNPYQTTRPPVMNQPQNITQQPLRSVAHEGIGHMGALSSANMGNSIQLNNSSAKVQQPKSNNNRSIIVSPNESEKSTQQKTNVSRPFLMANSNSNFTFTAKTAAPTTAVVSVSGLAPKTTTIRNILPKTVVVPGGPTPTVVVPVVPAAKNTVSPKIPVSKTITTTTYKPSAATDSTPVMAKTSTTAGSEQLLQGRISSEILKEQPVATYKPVQPPASLGFKEPLKTFKCQGCGDEFLFSTSLVNHLERKTIFINYSCEECGKFIAFYNRCCLFIHAKSHAKGAKAYRLNINLAYIKVLPEAFMPKIDSTHLKSIENSQPVSKDPSPKACQSGPSSEQNRSNSPTHGGKKSKSATKKMSSILNRNVNKQVLNSYNPNYYTVVTTKNKRFYKCLECEKPYASLHMYNNHFNGKMSKAPGLFKCSKCLTDVVGVCASSAHMRVHSKEKPYVCPECGEFISGSRDIFLKHLKQKCIHFQRTLLMRCTICNSVVLFDPETVAKHYMESHYSKYYKCLECPRAFKNTVTFESHKKTIHNDKAAHNLICKCALCDTVFHEMDNVQEHFKNDHWPEMSKHSCFTAFKCTHCSPQKLFNNRNAYSYHVTRMHGIHIVENMCNACGAEFNTEVAMKAHRQEAHNDFNLEHEKPLVNESSGEINGNEMSIEGVVASNSTPNDLKQTDNKETATVHECKRCNTLFRDESTYNSHMAKHRFVEKRKLMGDKVPALKLKKLKVENLSETHSFKIVSPETTKAPAEDPHKKEESEKQKKNKVFLGQVPTAPMPKPRQKCPECDEKFFSMDEVQEHLKMSHGITPQYSCHLCGNTYESQEMTERHIQVTHEGKSKDHPYLCWICLDNSNQIKGYGSWKMLEKHLTSHHKLHKNNIDYSRFPKFGVNGDADSDSVASKRSDADLDDHPVKRLKLADDSTFSCAKCKYQCDSRVTFVEHITKHKLDENDIQCLECGLCFAVFPSLKRHLFMVHKIRDFKKYQQESGVDVESARSVGKDGIIHPSPVKMHISQIPNGIAQPNLERFDKKKEPKKVAEVEVENPLECNVCYKVFDDDNALRKHMRMHGMAFIRSRRAQVPAWE